jgi:chlorobactene glucosyltransferase
VETLFWVLGIAALAAHFYSLATYLLNRLTLRVMKPDARRGSGVAPRISILIPARDEARAVGGTILAALNQDYPDHEVILVNDRSTDDTRALAEAAAAESSAPERFKLIEGSEPPAGWLGKPWALQLAAQAASGEFLLFMDADVRLHPATLAASERLLTGMPCDALALLPDLLREGFWNEVLEPVLSYMTLFAAVIPWLNWDGQRRAWIAGGAFLCVRRTAYELAGGHAAVRNQIIDDIGLAMKLKRAGLRCRIADGRAMVKLRMYHGLRESLNGFRKNLSATHSSLPLLMFGAVFYIATNVLQPLWGAGLGIAALAGAHATPGVILMIAGASLLLLNRLLLCIEIRQNPLYAFTHPLLGLTFSWVFILSCWDRFVRKEIVWRGRKIKPSDTDDLPAL